MHYLRALHNIISQAIKTYAWRKFEGLPIKRLESVPNTDVIPVTCPKGHTVAASSVTAWLDLPKASRTQKEGSYDFVVVADPDLGTDATLIAPRETGKGAAERLVDSMCAYYCSGGGHCRKER